MGPTICLNMIVKNESRVMRRLVESVRPLITHWLIVDNGSTDGTQALVRELLADLPGELVERPWKNFGHNRTEALALARGRADYLLIMDADEELELPPGYALPPLTAEEYWIVHRYRDPADVTWKRATLVKNDLPWKYVGVLHEYLELDEQRRYMRATLEGPTIWVYFDGARNADMDAKFANDARTLEAALVDEPGNARYWFYLAQSYRDSKQHDKAITAYEKRATLGGFVEEVYFSKLEVARLREERGDASAIVVAGYLDAHNTRPVRAEPLVALARHYRMNRGWAASELFARAAMGMPIPEDGLFVDVSAYTWRAIDELAIATYYTGKFAESVALAERLLAMPELPANERPRVETNRALSRAKI